MSTTKTLPRLATSKLNVGIIGFGVVGAATAHGLKSLGNQIYIHDVKDLTSFSNEFNVLPEYDLEKTDITLLTLPTPTVPLKLGGRIDLSALDDVTEYLGRKLENHDDYHVFVIRSTVPPGTTRRVGERLEQISGKRIGEEFGVAMNPEFLRAFRSVEDFQRPRVTVIGGYDERSGDLVEAIYSGILAPVARVGLEEAEMIKYAHNLFNAAKISYFNELWRISNYLGIDFEKVRETVVRTAESCWNPEYGTHGGLPYGGTCLPKDTLAMRQFLVDKGFSPSLLEAIINVNEETKNDPHKNGVVFDPYFQQRRHESYDNLR